HAAARVDMRGAWRDFQRDTVVGTRNLLDAALPARPRRFVYVSSAAVYGDAHDPQGCCADRTPTRPAKYNHYGRAKLLAEQEVRASCTPAGCEWTIVRLGFLYGEGNQALLRHLAPMLAARRVILIGEGDNRIATLHIDDAVEAVRLCALDPRAAGRIYDVASDEIVTQRQFLDATADALDLPRPHRNARIGLARLIARAVESCCAIIGRTPPFTRAMVDLMGADQAIDARRIRKELGWRTGVDFEHGMRRMAAWYAARADRDSHR
ncbi:MAG: NAD(P)-dependent oxidoreductase, partial [Planctomycetota bacterium]